MTTEPPRKAGRTTGTPLRTIRDHAAPPVTPAAFEAVDVRLLLLLIRAAATELLSTLTAETSGRRSGTAAR